MTSTPRFHFQAAVVALVWACLSGPALAQTGGATPTVRPGVFKPLQAAQDALKNNQAQQAVSLAKEALSMPQLTAFELISIQRTLAVAALNAKDFDQASTSLEALLAQPEIPPADRRLFLESLAQARLQKNDHSGAVKWARQYQAEGGSKPAMRWVLLQSLSHLNAHAEVIAQVQNWIQQDAGTGQKTSESELRLLAVSYSKLKDMAGYEATLLQLLEHYPSKAFWAEAIARQAQKSNSNPRFELDLYRLLEDTDNLEEVAEYIEMVDLALKAGLPAEAQRVVELGYKKGVLGQGGEAAAHLKLRQQIAAKLTEDEKLFEPLERGAKDGNSWAAVGDVLLSKQLWDKAKTAYTQALNMGNLRREAEVSLHLGMALFKSGQPEQCRKMLATIKEDPTALALANLWRIRTLTP